MPGQILFERIAEIADHLSVGRRTENYYNRPQVYPGMHLLKTNEGKNWLQSTLMRGWRPALTISAQLDLSLTITVLLVLGVARLSWLLMSLTEWIACELNFNWLIKGRVTSLGRWRSSNRIACALAFCSCGLPMSPCPLTYRATVWDKQGQMEGGKHWG